MDDPHKTLPETDLTGAEPEVQGSFATLVCPTHGKLDPSWAICPTCLRLAGAKEGTMAIASRPGSRVAATIVQSRPEALAQLELLSGSQTGATYTLAADVTSLGRDPHNSVCLPHPGVSRRHARIIRRQGELLIMDLGSTNGTFVNGQRITATVPLLDGDELRLGGVRLRVRLRSSASAT
jgi:pSer/pThr/pTyr-binding forkhead associated (FHA) protein